MENIFERWNSANVFKKLFDRAVTTNWRRDPVCGGLCFMNNIC